mgnify:CR=1 FL=1
MQESGRLKACVKARALFPPEIEVGMTIEGHALPVGCNPDAPSDIFYTVTDLYPDHVVLDGNHPLAGLSLYIDIRVADVREASAESAMYGTPDEIARKLEKLQAMGVDYVLLNGGAGVGVFFHKNATNGSPGSCLKPITA